MFSASAISKHSFVSLYPGTIYMPGDPLLIQSLGNSFIFRCSDGVLIDGNNKSLSNMIFKSIAGRLGPNSRNLSWLDLTNELAMGQIINNGGSQKCNVAYQEIDFTESELRSTRFKVNEVSYFASFIFCKFAEFGSENLKFDLFS